MEENDMEQLKERLCGRRLLFPLGQVVITRQAAAILLPDDVNKALSRHAQGDWGDVDAEDRISNEQALVDDTRLLSVYHATAGQKFWIITECDRSVTTILLPDDCQTPGDLSRLRRDARRATRRAIPETEHLAEP